MSAPWMKDGERERWVSVGKFAQIVNRSPFTVYKWLHRKDVLPAFGYQAYQDPIGRWYVQVTKRDLELLR
jgi:hypothetical protein